MPVFRGSGDRERKRDEGEQQPGEALVSFPAVRRAAFARAKGASAQAAVDVQLQQPFGVGKVSMGIGKGTCASSSTDVRYCRRGFGIRRPPEHLTSKVVNLILNASSDEEEDRMRDAWHLYLDRLRRGKAQIPSFLVHE